MKFTNYASAFGLIVLIAYILNIGKSILLPLAIAIVLWYLMSSLTREFQKIKIQKWQPPYWLGMVFAIITSIGAVYLFLNLMTGNINEIVEAAPAYQSKLEIIIAKTFNSLNIKEPASIEQLFNKVDLTSIAGYFASALTSMAGYMSLILVFLIFLLLEYRSFDEKLALIVHDKKRFKEIHKVFMRINNDIHEYLKIKTFVSFLTAILSYIVLRFAEVDFAAFWSILIFFLNFIPNIGSFIAVVFPVVLTLVQFDTLYTFAIVGTLLTSIQFIIGNIIEPKIMGKSLNLSPFVLILSLAFWGSIWGIIGMFLCVPIMVIINIILARIPGTKWIAIMLSADGKV